MSYVGTYPKKSRGRHNRRRSAAKRARFEHRVGVHDTRKQAEGSTTGKGIGVEEAPLGGDRRVAAMKRVP